MESHCGYGLSVCLDSVVRTYVSGLASPVSVTLKQTFRYRTGTVGLTVHCEGSSPSLSVTGGGAMPSFEGHNI